MGPGRRGLGGEPRRGPRLPRRARLAAPVTATILEHPIGQWLANNGKNPNLEPDRAAQLAAIDPDWKPAWPIDWQRRYTALNTLLAAGTRLEDVVPGVTLRGEDIGRWLAAQQRELPPP
ncbi:hypothetical protein [Streptomyces sp. A1136]|uniref:hypothetical protein n=1 Tax=Streptomyces sp. A1136 TaxID=2563102 RepID=UPI00109E95BA|nr:hypothetical protein [Streptomyces sp. A1136]THA49395.1 hypothetical protein E6R62_27715 [Streptomyces sp. A1136]